jgi:uncharacterized protein YndB with AHSA1/START domain
MKWLKWIFIVPVALVALATAALAIAGHLPDADRIRTSTEINAPPGKVWAFLNDEQNMKKWVSWLVDVKQSGPRGPGSTLTLTMRDENNGGALMRFQSLCTEYVPPTRLGETFIATEFKGSETYLLTDLGNGKTRLDIDSRYQFSQWFANLMSPLILPAAKSKLTADLAHLRALVEAS